jgi:hypothetical protein
MLVDLVSKAYIDDAYEWPIFDYVEAHFDRLRKDAWETIYSLPRVGMWQYGAAWWVGQSGNKPTAETQIELTVVGMHHSTFLSSRVAPFIATLQFMTDLIRNAPVSTREPRNLMVTAADLNEWVLSRGGVPLSMSTVATLPAMWRREPATMGGSEQTDPDGTWAKYVPRAVLDYEGVTNLTEYVDRLEALTAVPRVSPPEAAPSPLSLVSALDFLDVTWRLAHSRPLFVYPSADRAAKLTYAAATPEEFDSRLTALGEILRSANKTVKEMHPARLKGQTFEEPLAPFRDFLTNEAPTAGASSVPDAVSTLEAALSIRDAAQHAEAGGRAVAALAELGVAHPILDHDRAWSSVTARVVAALTTIREAIIAGI